MKSLENNFYETLLPEIFQERQDSQGPSTLSRLVRIAGEMFQDIHQEIDNIPSLFDPRMTDPKFLPWLASWVGLVLRADWDQQHQREVLARIIPLYRKRGTLAGLQEYLEIYTGRYEQDTQTFHLGTGVSIWDEVGQGDLHPLRVGVNSIVGEDGVIGGFPPYHFIVHIAFDTSNIEELGQRVESVKAVLDIEKPAHTTYEVKHQGPTLQVGHQSTIGTDTLI